MSVHDATGSSWPFLLKNPESLGFQDILERRDVAATCCTA
jgi:hypothetical protein